MNRWRSPTAEKIYRNKVSIRTRSGGTSSTARHQISLDDIEWSDMIIAMESKHKQRLNADYREAMKAKEIHVLEIEDNYTFMDPQLIEELRALIDPILDEKLTS